MNLELSALLEYSAASKSSSWIWQHSGMNGSEKKAATYKFPQRCLQWNKTTKPSSIHKHMKGSGPEGESRRHRPNELLNYCHSRGHEQCALAHFSAFEETKKKLAETRKKFLRCSAFKLRASFYHFRAEGKQSSAIAWQCEKGLRKGSQRVFSIACLEHT